MGKHSFLQVQQLEKHYPAPDRQSLSVFENVDFTIEEGEFVCVIGHSGCGKSTLLNVVAGLDKASAGYVFMAGRAVTGPSLDRGVIFQNHSLLPWKSAIDNVCFSVRARHPNWSRKQIRAHGEKFIEMDEPFGALDALTRRARRSPRPRPWTCRGRGPARRSSTSQATTTSATT